MLRRLLYHILFSVILLLLKTGKCFAQGQLTTGQGIQNLVKAAQRFEIAPMKEPQWSKKAGHPLFKVAWVTDMHLADANSINASRTVFNMIRDELDVSFTLITGDNCNYYEGLSEKENKYSVGIKRHLWLRRFLEKELNGLYAIIPGDNWPWDFEKVFGTQRYSFDFGGFHFLLTATDAVSPRRDTTSIFFDDTKAWIQEDLKRNADKPTFFVMHETIVPPSFPDAGWCTETLNANTNVVAAISGHLHLDLEFPQKTWTQFCGPSIGRSHRPAFKMLNFYQDQVILESYELQKYSGSIIKADKWQRVEIPRKLRASIKEWQKNGKPLAFANAQGMPARAKEQDTKLEARASEVEEALSNFIIQFGLSKFGLTP